MAAEIMPDYVRPLVKTHPSDSPSQVASPFKGYTSWWLRSGFPHLRFRVPALWFRWYVAAGGDAVSAQTVCWHSGAQVERQWRKERAR
jgi:putative transposase